MNLFGFDRTVVLLLFCAVLQSCATQTPVTEMPPPVTPTAAAQTDEPGELWWALRFRHHWPEDARPDFSRDLLLAHALLAPLIRDYEPVLTYWRFHRRAARDAGGHQFSLIFYMTADVAYEINEQLQSRPLVQAMLADGVLEKVWLDERSYAARNRKLVEATSDPHWVPRLQRAWPAFIQGVSQTWLQLIDLHVVPAEAMSDDPHELAEVYQQADDDIRTLWQSQGQHAFLHHLSAIFGYQPMLIRY